MDELDAAYEKLRRTGRAQAQKARWVQEQEPRSLRELWLHEQAVPWWNGLLQRAGTDRLPISCSIARLGPDPRDHHPDEFRGETPSASLLHPWTAQALPIDPAWRQSKGAPAVECWQQLAAEPRPQNPRLRQDALADDYARLRERGQVSALYYNSPVNNVRLQANPAVVLDEVLALNRLRQEQLERWCEEQLQPWFAQLVLWARADDLAISCDVRRDYSPSVNLDESQHLPAEAIFGHASLLDPETGLARGEAEQFLEAVPYSQVERTWIEEAKRRTGY